MKKIFLIFLFIVFLVIPYFSGTIPEAKAVDPTYVQILTAHTFTNSTWTVSVPSWGIPMAHGTTPYIYGAGNYVALYEYLGSGNNATFAEWNFTKTTIVTITDFNVSISAGESLGVGVMTVYLQVYNGTHWILGSIGIGGGSVTNVTLSGLNLANFTTTASINAIKMRISIINDYQGSNNNEFQVYNVLVHVAGTGYLATVNGNPEIHGTFVAYGTEYATPVQFTLTFNTSITFINTLSSTTYQFEHWTIETVSNNTAYYTNNVTISNVTEALNVTIFYVPFYGTVPPATVNLLDIPTRVGLALNVSPTVGGLLASIFALACIVAVIAIFTDNLFVFAAFLIMGMSVCVLLSWLPYFVLIFVIVIIAIMLAEKMSHLITGSGSGGAEK